MNIKTILMVLTAIGNATVMAQESVTETLTHAKKAAITHHNRLFVRGYGFTEAYAAAKEFEVLEECMKYNIESNTFDLRNPDNITTLMHCYNNSLVPYRKETLKMYPDENVRKVLSQGSQLVNQQINDMMSDQIDKQRKSLPTRSSIAPNQPSVIKLPQIPKIPTGSIRFLRCIK